MIGGGPAGMKCAMDLCDRGHKVTLYEATDHLGGAIHHSEFVDFKWTLRDFKNYLIHQVQKRDIEVLLNTKATPDMIAAENYDVVVAALGANPSTPPIPGLRERAHVYGAESMINPDALGHNVVVIGGGEVGVEAGMNLAKKGHEVTVLEMRPQLAMDSTMIHFRSMFEEAWLAIPSFHGITGVRVTGVTEDAVTYADANGVEHSVPADSVVVSAGMRAKQDEALGFYGTAPRFYQIGDCTAPGTVQQAMRTAFATAGQI